MNAQDLPFAQLLDGAKQFIVPIFQRDYSWGTRHCLQLWNDVLRAGGDANVKGHFLGSVVYVAAEENTAGITRWLLIDGQQRLTTLSLLLAALRDALGAADEADDDLPSVDEIDDYFLRNRHGKGDRRNKLLLRRADNETLTALIEKKEKPTSASGRIVENFEFFVERVKDADLPTVYRGIKKLIIVDVGLTRGQDDPQMIFESLNSTGLDLTQADLIRNFVLMRQDEALQTELYLEYWQPIEIAFGARYRTHFDWFVRDFLTLQIRPSTTLRADEIYKQFRSYFQGGTMDASGILSSLKRFGRYYVAFSLGQEENPKLKEPFRRLRVLVEVATPVVLQLYECFAHLKTLSLDEFVEAIELLESYVFRRSVCGMQTRSLGQMFASIAYRIAPERPLLSLKVALYRQGKKRRFPMDAEFREALETRDVYDMRQCHYLLDRLENDSKEKIDTSSFTIEHIMPQNESLVADWQAMLGPDWKAIQEVWLHRLGNVTLTGYNAEYSDRSFADKKTIPDGFSDSPLRLNKFVRESERWTPVEMEERGKQLASKAVGVWPSLSVDMSAVKKAELEERRAWAARYKIENLECDDWARTLLDQLRPQILALGTDVVELCGPKSITFRVYDFFVEVIPRKYRLLLLLNLDFADCNDPSGIVAPVVQGIPAPQLFVDQFAWTSASSKGDTTSSSTTAA